ncbi:MAG: hypothetical protein Q7T59_02945 [Candidatus Woesebacteria bacterium]|nr:hypothetical protein [Candidatus Woesebacteria bacterium]
MKECIHRSKVSSRRDIEKGTLNTQKQFNNENVQIIGVNIAGDLIQKFENGLCSFLTARDIGPMECRQPNCDQNNCPDIKGLK